MEWIIRVGGLGANQCFECHALHNIMQWYFKLPSMGVKSYSVFEILLVVEQDLVQCLIPG